MINIAFFLYTLMNVLEMNTKGNNDANMINPNANEK